MGKETQKTEANPGQLSRIFESDLLLEQSPISFH
jgi:hypothetical protein